MLEIPTLEQVEKELERLRYSSRYRSILRSTVNTLIVAIAIAIIIATLILPIFRIYGTSMTPTLVEGDMVAATKTERPNRGDLIAFYYNNKILVKRVIAIPGEWVNIDKDGNVYVNDKLLDEPYIKQKALGQCDIKLPYQVEQGRYFVMGDLRDVSIDSRTTSIGCIPQEQITGRLILKIWPLNRLGLIRN
ncbi:Signal peptidase I [Lachnospiraceae bacterium TWA4]|nr:Signal peptidase I [Lachnospiraceae bacterium TWA4]